jgi:hypothetical protein
VIDLDKHSLKDIRALSTRGGLVDARISDDQGLRPGHCRANIDIYRLRSASSDSTVAILQKPSVAC